MRKYQLGFVVFILLILSACNASESQIATAIAETELASPSETPAPTFTFIPTSTVTLTPSPAPTETLTPTTIISLIQTEQSYNCMTIGLFEDFIYSSIGVRAKFYPTVSTDATIWNKEFSWEDNGDIFNYLINEKDNCIITGVAYFIVSTEGDNAEFAGDFASILIGFLSPDSNGRAWFWDTHSSECFFAMDEIFEKFKFIDDETLWGLSCQFDSEKKLLMTMLQIILE